MIPDLPLLLFSIQFDLYLLSFCSVGSTRLDAVEYVTDA
jgi:hypothetical protein